MFCKPPHPVYIVLFRGDDTDFVGNQEIIVKITTERNISGCKAYFKYMGNIQTFDAIPEDKELHLVFSREQTKEMPLGTWDAELYLIDENGKRMTVNNRIHMLVTNSVREAYFPDDPQAVSVVISANKYIEDAEVSADGKTLTLTKKDGTEVSFSGGGGGGGTNDYNDLENKPSINGKTLTGNVNLATPEQLELKADKADLEGFATDADLLAFYYPDGSVTSMDQITTSGIEYAVGKDGGAYVVRGSGLSGHVVLPWKVTIGGAEYKVTAIGAGAFEGPNSFNSFTAPITVKSIEAYAFVSCVSLETVNLHSATSIGSGAFSSCHSLATVNLHSATSIGSGAFSSCVSLETVNLHSATSIGENAFGYCASLATVDFGSSPKSLVPVLDTDAFVEVPTSCRFIVPLGMYDEWTSAPVWRDLYTAGYKFEGYASTAQLANKADKATTLAGYGITDGATKASLAPEYSPASAYSVGAIVYHDGNIYQCKTAIADGGEAWSAEHWELRKLDDFFTNSNSLLTGTIDEEVIEKGTAPDAHLEAPTDERLKLILADSSVAYDSAKALPYKLTSVIGDRVIATMTLTAASTDITLPTIAANDTTVKDFILDVTNAYAVEGVATDAGINIPRTDFKLVTRDGESLTAVTTVKAGKSAFIRFTQKSPVVVDGTTYPCWCVIQLPFGNPS